MPDAIAEQHAFLSSILAMDPDMPRKGLVAALMARFPDMSRSTAYGRIREARGARVLPFGRGS